MNTIINTMINTIIAERISGGLDQDGDFVMTMHHGCGCCATAVCMTLDMVEQLAADLLFAVAIGRANKARSVIVEGGRA